MEKEEEEREVMRGLVQGRGGSTGGAVHRQHASAPAATARQGGPSPTSTCILAASALRMNARLTADLSVAMLPLVLWTCMGNV